MSSAVEDALIRRASLFQKEATLDNSRLEPLKYKGHCIAAFTSGGDSQGMNAAVRAVVRMGMYLGCKVYLIYEGYQGLVDGGKNFHLATWDSVSGIMKLGGTVIGSARCKDFREEWGQKQAAKNLIDREITSMVCVGGDGSLTGADEFRAEWPKLIKALLDDGTITQAQADKCATLNIVGLVGSIDNDFCGTDMTIGADSALHRIIEAVDNITPTAQSHQRCFVLEVMGRHCGYLALVGGLAAEADWIFVPEWPPEEGWEEKLCKRLSGEREHGSRLNIIIVAEGAIDRSGNAITAEQVKDMIAEKVKLDTRVTVLGHIQRGGNPSAFDRIMASRMGAEAVLALLEQEEGAESSVISYISNEIKRVSLMDAVSRTRSVATKMGEKNFVEAVQLRGKTFQNNLEVSVMMSGDMPSVDPDTSNIVGLLNAGDLACGMNAAARSFVRRAATRGYRVLGIRNGFEGLMSKQTTELSWNSVTGWTCRGGAELGVSKVTPDKIGFKKVAEALEELKLKGLMIVGGFEAYYSALGLLEMRKSHPVFNMPIIVLPASIYNDMPGTDLTVGADTALNQIRDVCDKLNITARSTTGQVFIVETLGDYCGYLATMSGLLSGADIVYIHEQPFSAQDVQRDAEELVTKMKTGVNKGIVLKSNMAHEIFNADFITRFYAQEGKGTFSARPIIIGEMQSGYRPSAFDRVAGTKMGLRCAEKLISQIESPDGGETCTVIGNRQNADRFKSVAELKTQVNYKHKVCKDNTWWLKMKPLLLLLSAHTSVYDAQ